jgi:2'-deoxynucleoside 5'-phosphate N-hydrolase
MMKAYLGIKFHPDDRNRETIERLSQTLASCGFETLCVRRDLERWGAVAMSPQQLMTRTFEAIRACHLAVIDLTEKGVGLGIEAGYAYAQMIPVITVAREGSDISDTLRGISQGIFFYRAPADLRECFMRLRLLNQDQVRMRELSGF